MKKYIIPISLILFCSFSLQMTACSSNTSTSRTERNTIATTTQSPIEELDYHEEKIFNSFIKVLEGCTYVNSPQSIRMLDIKARYGDAYIRLTGSDEFYDIISLGLTEADTLGLSEDVMDTMRGIDRLYHRATDFGTFYPEVTSKDWSEAETEYTVDVAKINHALSYYWESKGL